jgi:hypothetical protein
MITDASYVGITDRVERGKVTCDIEKGRMGEVGAVLKANRWEELPAFNHLL